MLTALLVAIAAGAQAQTDVTATYLTNPSFEADASACTDAVRKSEAADGLRGWDVASVTGWTTTRPSKQLLITADCFTDNNFGKTSIADGTYALFQREGWTNSSSAVTQTTAIAVPAGKYQLSASYKAFYANSASSSATLSVKQGTTTLGAAAMSFASGSANCMGGAWSEATVQFEVKNAAALTIAVNVDWVSGGSQLALDNFRLTTLPDDTPIVDLSPQSGVTEGKITHDFVDEATMMQDLLQMLANSTRYAKNIWFQCVAPNSVGETCGYFKGNSAGQSNEDGVRTNADFAMICAFLVKHAQGKVGLPAGVTWTDIRQMAKDALVFGYSTHKANRLKVTADNKYWGSTSTSDAVWESSLWTMSLAYAAHFLADELTDAQRTYIYNMVKAECNYELQRSIPTGYAGDTKAEENGWEADVLACALGLYPDDALAPQWFARLREFAINSYSHSSDASDNTVIDPTYDQKTVAQLYRGANLYDDYTLQNHNYFHTSYQNVVMQELGEAHLAMLLFQGSAPRWQTHALMHNQQRVMDEVLCRLALSDGELAMPNGNDWSMFLYDQITSYSTAACFLRDPNALMLENMAYKYIKARQTTTGDGSWLLRSDIGPRRMGVEGHRVMMTYLMHLQASTASLQPTTWDAFCRAHQDAYVFPAQNIVRAMSDDRFACFSWSDGLKSYTGYFADTTPDRNKIVVPYKANNTGNIIGWYTVDGKSTDATPEVKGVYELDGNAFTMNGRLKTNGGTLENSFVIAATRANAVVYMNRVRAAAAARVTGRRGGLLAVSADELTATERTIYNAGTAVSGNGASMQTMATAWANIDNHVGIVTLGGTGQMAFGDRANSNSVMTAKLYPLFSNEQKSYAAGDEVDRTAVIYYSRVDAAQTAALQTRAKSLDAQMPTGWNAITFDDADGTPYLLAANFGGTGRAKVSGLATDDGAPVLTEETTIADGKSSATLILDRDHSLLLPLTLTVSGADVIARLISLSTDATLASIRAIGNATQTATIKARVGSNVVSKQLTIEPQGTYLITLDDGQLTATRQDDEQPSDQTWLDVTALYLTNPGFEQDATWATEGSITLGGVAYNPCYTQSVAPADTRFPQVLPVAGWMPAGNLATASNYAILYSMPYSDTQYCVSPSSLGNSASIMSQPARYADAAQTRCLSIMNSWTAGRNAIEQKATVKAGTYRLRFLAHYVCPNQASRTATQVQTSGGNVNTSLCGLRTPYTETYAYPAAPNTWEDITIPFEMEETGDVTVRLGLETSQGKGAADNTRLYIDAVRIERLKTWTDGVGDLGAQDARSLPSACGTNGPELYDLAGRRVAATTTRCGIYVSDGRKVVR